MLAGLGAMMPMIMVMDDDGWGKWEATQTVVLNADADYGHGIDLLGTSVALAPSDFFLV